MTCGFEIVLDKNNPSKIRAKKVSNMDSDNPNWTPKIIGMKCWTMSGSSKLRYGGQNIGGNFVNDRSGSEKIRYGD